MIEIEMDRIEIKAELPKIKGLLLLVSACVQRKDNVY